MKNSHQRRSRSLVVFAISLLVLPTRAAELPASAYHIYAGSTHAHTSNTWSHGDHFINPKKENNETKEPALTVSPDGVQSPAKTKALKPDWQKQQGSPSQHFTCAKT